MQSVVEKFIPGKVYSSYGGYTHLIQLHNSLKDISNHKIFLNFSECTWFEANLTAILAAITDSANKRGNTIQPINLSSKIKDVFQRNHFLRSFGYGKIIDENKTIIILEKFHPREDSRFAQYIRNELLNKRDFPKLSRMAAKKINESIFELFENARTHGQCEYIYACGQYYPQNRPPRIDFTIVDMGKTIKTNVNQFLKKDMQGDEAIEWALEYGHTTKTGNISGGLGLDLILEFIKLNKGKFQIVSADGFWQYSKYRITKNSFDVPFPGTIANLEFNLDDKDYYRLMEEISQDNIF